MTPSNGNIFPRYWPFVQGVQQSPANSPHKIQWRGALMFSLICAWINCWVNNRESGDLRRHHAHYDVSVMKTTLKFVSYKPGLISSKWVSSIIVKNCTQSDLAILYSIHIHRQCRTYLVIGSGNLITCRGMSGYDSILGYARRIYQRPGFCLVHRNQ